MPDYRPLGVADGLKKFASSCRNAGPPIVLLDDRLVPCPEKAGGSHMAKVVFTQNIQRHVVCPDAEAAGTTVREVLDNLFAANPQARAYVLDDQAALRRHMTIFVDGKMIHDRTRL